MKEVSHGSETQNSAKIGLRYDHYEFIHISSNFRRVVQSAVTNEFNTVRNMALHYFRLRFSGRFAYEHFSRKEILAAGLA